MVTLYLTPGVQSSPVNVNVILPFFALTIGGIFPITVMKNYLNKKRAALTLASQRTAKRSKPIPFSSLFRIKQIPYPSFPLHFSFNGAHSRTLRVSLG